MKLSLRYSPWPSPHNQITKLGEHTRTAHLGSLVPLAPPGKAAGLNFSRIQAPRKGNFE
jgi:hypothetical protein